MVSPTTPQTLFTLDVTGRYVCNSWDEAVASLDTVKDPDARPFDLIVIGGGTFGSILACHLFNRDQTHAHRILVLEAGPVVFTEHVQNQPLLTTAEVWGIPWNSDSPKPWNTRFQGLAYCVGGRSLFWGGWSPYFLDSELRSPPWPASVRYDLTQKVLASGTLSYLDEAAEQIGTASTNDFVFGALHTALRKRLFDGIVARAPDPNTILAGSRGTQMTAPGRTPAQLQEELEAPLAVESQSPRPGAFAFNKFCATPLLIRASRQAQSEAEQSAAGGPAAKDVKKRMMIVDETHVIRLERVGRRVVRIVTNKGVIDVPPNGTVFLALGTIESTRLALETAPNTDGLIGRNLMAHLRSNVTIRVPRASFAALDLAAHPELKEMQVSALFVKGIHTHEDDTLGHFHVQITASGVGALGMESEAELFKRIPDIDTLERFAGLTDQWIVITLRGIGEMVGDKTSKDPQNRISLGGPEGAYDYGAPRALVRLEAGPAGSKDLALWDAMDRACDELALIFANGGPIEYLSGQANAVWQPTPPGPDARRDALSSTHHEGGTLWMGDDPATSVTDQWGRLHEMDNLYALGPALLPTLGSPNPMLSGVALSRRLGDHLLPLPAPLVLPPGFAPLFDGTERSFSTWQTVGGGAFALIDGAIVAQPDPGGELGLLYYALRTFDDFTLRLEFRLIDVHSDNSGVFVRFREPRRPVPDRVNPAITYAYQNQHWVAVNTGFEIQIDEQAQPDGLDMHRTGAIYDIPTVPGGPQVQQFTRGPILTPGNWNEYLIVVKGDTYTVHLNGAQATTFTNTDTYRGKSPKADPYSGYIGLQAHTGRVAFRHICIKV